MDLTVPDAKDEDEGTYPVLDVMRGEKEPKGETPWGSKVRP